MNAGRITAALFLESVLLFTVLSCTSAVNSSLPPSPEKTVSSTEAPGNNKSAAPEIQAGSQTGSPAEGPAETDLDPLEEVSRLWFTGRVQEAINRFGDEDVSRLASGDRRSEWSLWRGRLFTEKWRGSDIGLAGENISSILSDGDDVWAGTWTGGIARLSEPLDIYDVWDRGLPSLAVRTINRIIREQDSIWIVRYGAIERYNMRSGIWSVEPDLPVSERLQDLCFTDGRPYLATLGHGLWVKENRRWRMLPTPGLFITRLETRQNGQILVGTMDRGLFIYNPGDDSWKQAPGNFLRESNITSVLESGNQIIGGTYGSGAFIWDMETESVRHISSEELGDPWVLAVAESSGRYFFGTFGAGLVSLDSSDGAWDYVGIAEGFPSADIASLSIDDNGNIWAGTLGGGIIRISGGIYGN